MRSKSYQSSRIRLVGLAAVAALMASACASSAGVTTVVESSAPPPGAAAGASAGAGAVQALEQAAVWPAPETIFATPEEAAVDFVANALGVNPNLSEFMEGDHRSGEFTLYSPGEGGTEPITRGTIGVRQLGPSAGWYVTFVLGDGQEIISPTYSDKVGPCTTTVSGSGRGFEGTITVKAFVPGNATPIDQAVGAGGAMEDVANWSVDLDLSSVTGPVALVAQGGVGLEDDPGETAAVGIIVDSSISCGDNAGGGNGGGTGGGGTGGDGSGGDGGIKMTG